MNVVIDGVEFAPAPKQFDGIEFSELLKQRRKQLGLSLQEVADKCGTTKTYIWQLEDGRSNAGRLLLNRLRIALGLDALTLLSAPDSEK